MNDRNFYERRLGNPGYDAVARKKIKELEKAVGGGYDFTAYIIEDYDTDSNSVTFDKTYEEVVGMVEAGKMPVMRVLTTVHEEGEEDYSYETLYTFNSWGSGNVEADQEYLVFTTPPCLVGGMTSDLTGNMSDLHFAVSARIWAYRDNRLRDGNMRIDVAEVQVDDGVYPPGH